MGTTIKNLTDGVAAKDAAAVDQLAAGTVTAVTGVAPIASSGGATPAISHNDSGVVAASYGDATNVPQIAVSAKGHITGGANNVPIAFPVTSVATAAGSGTHNSTGSPGPAVSVIADVWQRFGYMFSTLYAPIANGAQGLSPQITGSILSNYPGGVARTIEASVGFNYQTLVAIFNIISLAALVVGETFDLYITKNGAIVATVTIPDGTTGLVSVAFAGGGVAADTVGVAVAGHQTSGGTVASMWELTAKS